jgi:hypothetical protein
VIPSGESDAALFARLDAAWRNRWSDVLPVLETRWSSDTWVRFHSLPESKRYAQTDDERAEILRRHRAVLSDLLDGATDLLVLCADWDERDAAHDWHLELLPSARFWRSVQREVDEPVTTLWADTSFGGLDALEPMLLAIADDRAGPVVITSSSPEWLYHPYDGGADVIAATGDQENALRTRYADWLPRTPSGL